MGSSEPDFYREELGKDKTKTRHTDTHNTGRGRVAGALEKCNRACSHDDQHQEGTMLAGG
jgi:hypothetical protein